MRKVVFFDRDGVVNVERGEYTWKLEDFKINVGLIDFMKWVKNFGFEMIIISNQGGIGKGVYTHNDVIRAHNYLLNELRKNDLDLLEIYYCPHHPNTGKCLCRKPESIMLEKAIARFNVDVTKSIFIGDSKRDIEAGQKVGLHTLLVQPNENLNLYRETISGMLKF